MRFRTVSIPGGVANAGSETILDWAQKSPTSISLQSLWKAGKAPSEDSGKQRLLNAKFLTHELRVRTAQRALELKSLPFKLSEKKPIMKVIDYYHRIFEGLDALKTPETLEDDAEFVTALQTIVLSNHEDVIQNMALGVRALRREMGPAYGGLANRNTLDMHLNRFFISRIGLRFLIEHHIESREARKGYSGIIASACSPLAVVRRAAEDCAYTARYHYGDAPHVDVIGDPEMTFTYVPCKSFAPIPQKRHTRRFEFTAATPRAPNSRSLPLCPEKINFPEKINNLKPKHLSFPAREAPGSYPPRPLALAPALALRVSSS